MILIGSLALIVFHYVEILFGIPVITSRALFWVTCGLMLAIGQGLLPEARDAPDKNNMETAKRASRQFSPQGKNSKKTMEPELLDLRQAGIHVGVMIAMVTALSPLLISTNRFGLDTATIVIDALVANSPALYLFLGAILFSCLLFEAEAAALSNRKVLLLNFILLFIVAFFASFLMWMLYASQVAVVWQSPDASAFEMVARYLGLLNAQFVTTVIFAYVLAFLLSEPAAARQALPLKMPVLAGLGLIHLLALALSIFVNLRPFQANGIAKLLNGYIRYDRFSEAFDVGKRLLKLDPWQDVYFLGAADTASQYASALSDPQEDMETLSTAEEYYQRAYALNPAYLRNILGMAHINRTWARVLTQDVAAREARIDRAERYYADMLEGKPYRVKLWVEWAEFRDEIGDTQGARQRIDAALKIDNAYAPAYSLSVKLYTAEADKLDDPAKRGALLGKAVAELTAKIEALNRRGENPSSALLQLGDLYVRLQLYDQAREAYLQAERIGLGDSQWKVYQKLAEVSGMMSDVAAQRDYFQKAIAIAPAEETSGLQAALDALTP
jgi:hypothetical protein